MLPEAVDDKAADKRTFPGIKNFHGAEKRGKNAAPVNVADQQNVGLGVAGHGHVDNVMVLQVHFRRAAGTFHDDDACSAASES
jgi:hypothetical protein